MSRMNELFITMVNCKLEVSYYFYKSDLHIGYCFDSIEEKDIKQKIVDVNDIKTNKFVFKGNSVIKIHDGYEFKGKNKIDVGEQYLKLNNKFEPLHEVVDVDTRNFPRHSHLVYRSKDKLEKKNNKKYKVYKTKEKFIPHYQSNSVELKDIDYNPSLDELTEVDIKDQDYYVSEYYLVDEDEEKIIPHRKVCEVLTISELVLPLSFGFGGRMTLCEKFILLQPVFCGIYDPVYKSYKEGDRTFIISNMAKELLKMNIKNLSEEDVWRLFNIMF
jgi:hypothetical protein